MSTRVRLDEYLRKMRPAAQRLADRSEHNHPYLGRGDLEQAALIALWHVWQKWHTKVPVEEMCQIGNAAMRNAVVSQYRYAYQEKRGTADQVVSLEHEGLDVLGMDGVLDLLMEMMQDSLATFLSADAELLLHHYVVPDSRLQQLMGRMWKRKPKHWSWPNVETATLSKLLGWTPAKVLRARTELRRTVRWFLGLKQLHRQR